MKIVSTQYTLQYSSFEIYVSGCDGFCGEACHNYEIQDFNLGNKYEEELPKIINKIKEFDNMIDWVWILGGEPLLQNTSELYDMIKTIKSDTQKKIFLWTRFDLENVPDNIKEICDYIKTGHYNECLKTENNIQYEIKLATSNQKINKKGINY